MRIRYSEKFDMFIVEIDENIYLFDEFSVYTVSDDKFVKVEKYPEIINILRKIYKKAFCDYVYERSIYEMRIKSVTFSFDDLPTAVPFDKYMKFLEMYERDLLPGGFIDELEKYAIDNIHMTIGSYFGAYMSIGRAGPYIVIDSRGLMKEAYDAVKRYDERGKILPVGWWKKLWYKDYTGRASFTVYGYLHSCNKDSRVWFLSYHRESGNDVRIVHKAFLKAFEEFAGINFNREILKLPSRNQTEINKFLENGLINKLFEGFEKADIEIFDEIGMPREFISPVNYILLRDYGYIGVPVIDLKANYIPKELKEYSRMIANKIKKVL